MLTFFPVTSRLYFDLRIAPRIIIIVMYYTSRYSLVPLGSWLSHYLGAQTMD
jgi:hypothetical protein